MKEELISLKIAILAKEKEFQIPTQKAYINNKLFVNFEDSQGVEREYFFDADDLYENWNKKDWVFDKQGCSCFGCKLDNKNWFTAYSAPTQSLLQKWLRDIHFIDVEPKAIRFVGDEKASYYNNYINGSMVEMKKYNTYEEALEEGLYQALLLI